MNISVSLKGLSSKVLDRLETIERSLPGSARRRGEGGFSMEDLRFSFRVDGFEEKVNGRSASARHWREVDAVLTTLGLAGARIVEVRGGEGDAPYIPTKASEVLAPLLAVLTALVENIYPGRLPPDVILLQDLLLSATTDGDDTLLQVAFHVRAKAIEHLLATYGYGADILLRPESARRAAPAPSAAPAPATPRIDTRNLERLVIFQIGRRAINADILREHLSGRRGGAYRFRTGEDFDESLRKALRGADLTLPLLVEPGVDARALFRSLAPCYRMPIQRIEIGSTAEDFGLVARYTEWQRTAARLWRRLDTGEMTSRLATPLARVSLNPEAADGRSLYEAMISYAENATARERGYRWNRERRRWQKRLTEIEAREEPFRLELVAE